MTTKVKLWLPGNCKTDACPCPTKSEHARPDRVGFTNLPTRSENGILWWTTALKVAELTGGVFLPALVAIYRGHGNELVQKCKKRLKEMKNQVSWIKPREDKTPNRVQLTSRVKRQSETPQIQSPSCLLWVRLKKSCNCSWSCDWISLRCSGQVNVWMWACGLIRITCCHITLLFYPQPTAVSQCAAHGRVWFYLFNRTWQWATTRCISVSLRFTVDASALPTCALLINARFNSSEGQSGKRAEINYILFDKINKSKCRTI